MADVSVTTRFYRKPVSFEWNIEDYYDFPQTVTPTLNISVDNESFVLTLYKWRGVFLLSIGKVDPPSQALSTVLHYAVALVQINGNRLFENRGNIAQLEHKHDSQYAHKGVYRYAIILNVPLSELNKNRENLLKNGCLTIHGELKHMGMTSKAESAVSYYLPDGLSVDFGKMFIEKMHTDVVLSVEKHQIPVHTAILSARSSVFAAMFQHDMSEKRKKNVSIADVSPATMQRLLHFIYMGKIDNKAEHVADLPSGELSQLYAAADKYAILGLKEMCSHIMRTKPKPKKSQNKAISS